jgi:peptide/nickel transport system permease protein
MATGNTVEVKAALPQRSSQPSIMTLVRALVSDKATLLAAIFLCMVVVAAFGANYIAPHDPYEQALQMRNKPPGTPALQPGLLPHLLGTDPLGRDLLSRVIFGSRVSLSVGLLSVLVSGALGVSLGLLAGYYRGRMDDIVMRVVDLQMGFPSLLLALFILNVIGPNFRNVILILVLTRWMVYARVVRAMVFSLREAPFVDAARSIGCDDRRIILRHVLPSVLSPVLALATLEVPYVMLTEASLSFLGLGIQPPESSWGLMLSQGREYITSAWWLITVPGIAIFFTALSFNLVATWMRSVTDPVHGWRWLQNQTS